MGLCVSGRQTVLEIFTFEKYCDLQTGARCHWRSLKMTLFDIPPMTSCWCSIVTMARTVSCLFYDIQCQNISRPWKSRSRVNHGNWKCYIVILSLRCAVFEILACKYAVTLKPGLGVTQGHQTRHVSIRHLWLPINLPQKPWAYLVPFQR